MTIKETILTPVTRNAITKYLKENNIPYEQDKNTKALKFKDYILRQLEDEGVQLLKSGKVELTGDPTEQSIIDKISDTFNPNALGLVQAVTSPFTKRCQHCSKIIDSGNYCPECAKELASTAYGDN